MDVDIVTGDTQRNHASQGELSPARRDTSVMSRCTPTWSSRTSKITSACHPKRSATRCSNSRASSSNPQGQGVTTCPMKPTAPQPAPEPTPPNTPPTTPPGGTEPQNGPSVDPTPDPTEPRESSRYSDVVARLSVREQELADARSRVDAMLTRQAEQLAASTLAQGADVWLDGVTLSGIAQRTR